MSLQDYKGVWVYAEQREGQLQKVAFELIGTGREIADKLNEELTAVVLGKDIAGLAEECLAYGADKVIYVDDEKLENYNTEGYTEALCKLTNEKKPEIIMMGATYLGRDLGPRVSSRLATGLTADCTSLDVDEEGHLMMTRPAFGGNIMATIMCTDHRPQMATVRPGVFPMLEKDASRVDGSRIERADLALEVDPSIVKLVKRVKELKDIVDITEAEFIVSGGRGVGTEENFTQLHGLAKALGGTVAGSRAATDSGWLDHGLQVGQTGKTVRPKIYVACGISGAIQHLAGMQDSEYIIAINKDADAPIMKIADLGIVGDLNKIVPELTAQITMSK